MSKSPFQRAIYFLRDLRSRRLFELLDEHCDGEVLDVGGWDFFVTAQTKGVRFETWTTLEPDETRSLELDDPNHRMVYGDGCQMSFPDASFDTVLCIQVLEHVFDPFAMFSESLRVLRPGGIAIFMAPWTANLHLAPDHFQNFTRYWFEEAVARSGAELEVLEAQGGYWSSVASRHFLYPFQVARTDGMHIPDSHRGVLQRLLAPLALANAAVGFVTAMALSVADLEEEPNNHIVVVRKPRSTGGVNNDGPMSGKTSQG